MLPSSRIQATIELLDTLYTAWDAGKRKPADKLLEQYFKARRYIGSKDRAAIAELFYWILRHQANLEWWIERVQGASPSSGRDARLLALSALTLRNDAKLSEIPAMFTGEQYAPRKLSAIEEGYFKRIAGKSLLHADMPAWVRYNYPAWLHPAFEELFGETLAREMEALCAQASVDLRSNSLKITRDALIDKLHAEGITCTPIPHTPYGIRLDNRAAIFASPLFKAGYFEMQDAGSQALAMLVEAKPGQKIIDFCAGAGGKTLSLAADMKNKGRILAFDTSSVRLEQMRPRLRRAGVDNVQWHVLTSENDPFIKRHKASADRVLIDAPCSGTGTWRRNPDLKWRFNAQDLCEIEALQKAILQSASRLVKPGGRLIYATCSLLASENEAQIAHFLTNNNHFSVVPTGKMWDKTPAETNRDSSPYFRVTPHQDGMDGFFAAVLERTL